MPDMTKSRMKKSSLQDFEMLKVLGKGCVGKVLLVRYKPQGKLLAMKSIHKHHVLAHRELQHTLTEQSVLKAVASARDGDGSANPFVVKMYSSFHDKDNLYLLLDFHPGGDLATQLARWGRLGRDRTRFYASELAEGLIGLHNAGVIYRDLKPENVLIAADGHIVLTDFGLSKQFPRPNQYDSQTTATNTPTKNDNPRLPNWMKKNKDNSHGHNDNNNNSQFVKHDNSERTATNCGTAEYLAPEIILNQFYSYNVDWWSFGTMLYEMLAGITPFWAEDTPSMYRRVLHDELRFEEDYTMDEDTRNFIRGLLQKDPELRINDKRVKKHKYFEMIDFNYVYHKRYIPPYVPILDPSNEADTSYFDATYLDMPPELDRMSVHLDDNNNRNGGRDYEPQNAVDENGKDVFDGYSYRGNDIDSIMDSGASTSSSNSSIADYSSDNDDNLDQDDKQKQQEQERRQPLNNHNHNHQQPHPQPQDDENALEIVHQSNGHYQQLHSNKKPNGSSLLSTPSSSPAATPTSILTHDSNYKSNSLIDSTPSKVNNTSYTNDNNNIMVSTKTPESSQAVTPITPTTPNLTSNDDSHPDYYHNNQNSSSSRQSTLVRPEESMSSLIAKISDDRFQAVLQHESEEDIVVYPNDSPDNYKTATDLSMDTTSRSRRPPSSPLPGHHQDPFITTTNGRLSSQAHNTSHTIFDGNVADEDEDDNDDFEDDEGGWDIVERPGRAAANERNGRRKTNTLWARGVRDKYKLQLLPSTRNLQQQHQQHALQQQHQQQQHPSYTASRSSKRNRLFNNYANDSQNSSQYSVDVSSTTRSTSSNTPTTSIMNNASNNSSSTANNNHNPVNNDNNSQTQFIHSSSSSSQSQGGLFSRSSLLKSTTEFGLSRLSKRSLKTSADAADVDPSSPSKDIDQQDLSKSKTPTSKSRFNRRSMATTSQTLRSSASQKQQVVGGRKLSASISVGDLHTMSQQQQQNHDGLVNGNHSLMHDRLVEEEQENNQNEPDGIFSDSEQQRPSVFRKSNKASKRTSRMKGLNLHGTFNLFHPR